MTPKKITTDQGELFRNRLSNQLNPREPLFILSHQINWSYFEEVFGAQYSFGQGQPPKPIRLMVGLLILQHMHGLSDEGVVSTWVQNPYWQYFCGYDFLQWDFPCDPSSLTRWRQRLGSEGIEKILAQTIETAVKTETVDKSEFSKVIVDTTVMEKNVTHPTDSKLMHRAQRQLVSLTTKHGLNLRQSYARLGKKAALMTGRYAHAKQFKRMRKEVKKLKNYLGRTVRDIERQIEKSPDLQKVFSSLLSKSHRLLVQTKDSKNKLYSLHAPEVYCIAKGKANKAYEFGCKVSLVLTHKSGLALSSEALADNLFDGHTLKSSLAKAESLSGCVISTAFADKGYKGHGIEDKKIYISGQKRGITRALKRDMKRRSAIEPQIGHMKSDGKLGRNYLKGHIGDVFNALLTAIGHNMRMVLRHIRSIFAYILAYLNQTFGTTLIQSRGLSTA